MARNEPGPYAVEAGQSPRAAYADPGSVMATFAEAMRKRWANGPSTAQPTIQIPQTASAFQLKGLFGGESVQPDRSLRSYEDYSYGYNGTDPFLIQLAAILNNLDLGDR